MQRPEPNAHQAIKQLFALHWEVNRLRKEINAVRSRLWLDVASGVIVAVTILGGVNVIALNLAGSQRISESGSQIRSIKLP